MSLLYEYGERKEQAGMKAILLEFIDGGSSVDELSQMTGRSVEELNDIIYG